MKFGVFTFVCVLVVYIPLFLIFLQKHNCQQDVGSNNKLELELEKERQLKDELQSKLNNLERQLQGFNNLEKLDTKTTNNSFIHTEIQTKEQILWSIILTGRNDDYGAEYIKRLNNFLRNLSFLIKKYKISAEVLITEWNPLKDKEPLYQVIDKSIGTHVRIITVPEYEHSKIENSDIFGVFEFIGKNVAARRAKGKWVLFTNSDNIFNEDVGEFLGQDSYEDNCFYRVFRIDFKGPISDNIDPEYYWGVCRDTAFRIGKPGGWNKFEKQEERSSFWDEWDKMAKENKEHKEKSYPRNIVGNYNTIAAGDWTAFNTLKFIELKGYIEEPTYGTHDSTMLMIAGVQGMCQINLVSPYGTCHLEHDRSQNKYLPQTPTGVVWNKVLANKNPQTNNEEWGLLHVKLNERVLEDGQWIERESVILNIEQTIT